MLFFLLLLASCAAVKSSTRTSSPNSIGVDLEVKKFTLKNGLRLLVYENPRLPIFTYYTFYEIGSRYERPGVTGSTHFLEHMMFKGSKNYGPHSFDNLTFANGGYSNAYTTYDRTVYHQALPSSKLKEVINLEADRLKYISLDNDLLENERKVILEERKMRLENKASSKLFTKMFESLFEGTPYASPVIGSITDILGTSRDDLMDFFKRYYVPNNMVIIVAGDVKASEVYDLVKEGFGSVPSRPEVETDKLKMDEPALFTFKGRYNRSVRVHGDNPNPIFSYYFKGHPVGTRKAYVADIVGTIISGKESSYLQEKLVQARRAKFTQIYAQNMSLRRSGAFIVGGSLHPKVKISKAKKIVEKYLARACDKAINQRELTKALNNYLVGYYNSTQSNGGVASIIGAGESIYNNYNQYLKDIEEYSSITVKEAKEVCREILNFDNSIFGSVWNKHPKNLDIK